MKPNYVYIIPAAIILILVAYAMVPKTEPEASITISSLQFLNEDQNNPQIGVSIKWESDIQPTYLTVDIQPQGAPAVILPADRDLYHLILLPNKWVNTHTVFDKTGEFNQAYLINSRGGRNFQVVVELKNDDLTSEEYIAIDTELLSMDSTELTTPIQ